MFVHYRTKSIIFKKEDRGEADQLFTFYTKDFGKLEILGRAIRKISSKLRSGAELFYLSEIEFIQGKTHKTLTDAISIEKFRNLRKSLKRLAIAYKISGVLAKLVKFQEPDEKIWRLLNETFKNLNNSNLKSTICNLLPYYFLWNLLSILGYKAELYNCVICQKKLLPEKLYFNSKEGGLICQNCFKKVKLVEEDKSSSLPFAAARVGKEVKPDIVKILRIILEKNWLTLSKLKIEKDFLKELASVSKNYLSFIVDEAEASAA